ncbi:hypothetical protein GCM10022239_05780 [Leifsonia bigeumensis]|uniref:HTH araC/xylS-type domain-containing protein n=1 Tax=Leifsonella bigeumensis TaxID=433643 RepID=A0ABP7FBD9_9MICO
MTWSPLRIRPQPVRVADYLPAETYGPRVLHDYEFVWLLSGSAQWRVEERAAAGGGPTRHEHDLRPGMLALARAGTTDSYRWDSRRASSHAFVHFEVESRGLLGPESDWPLIQTMTGNEPLAGLCSYLLNLANDDSREARLRSEEIVTLLLDIFVRGPLPPAARSLIPARLVLVIDVIRSIWETDGIRIVSTSELAHATRMSPGHLSRLFHQEFHCGPAGGLEIIRLTRAAIALQRSNLSLTEVAALSGFSNPYHFSRRFSLIYGTSPGRFRRHGRSDPLQPLEEAGLLPLWGALFDRERLAPESPRH